MKTKIISAYILRGSTAALLFSCVSVALCSAINLPEQPPKALPPQSNAGFGANAHQSAASVPASASSSNRSLSFADRVAYQRAIEDVYWRHRIWPKERPDPKPSLDAVMSQAQLEKKVDAYLRNSQALEDWQRPITADQLQTERERMAQHTRQPEVLRELFEALGNDPFVIAECLARSVLSERLESNFCAYDQRFQGELRQRAEADVQAENQMPKLTAAVSSANYTLPIIASPSGGCTDNTWTPTSFTNAPAARQNHTAVWTENEMIVWGGNANNVALNTGGRYDPSTDSWTATSTIGAPTGRSSHTAVWTGSEMIVWGGIAGFVPPVNTGGRYNPSTDSWIATSLINAPAARTDHTAVWTGSEMIVWGGAGSGGYFNTGGRYNPSNDTWTATSTTNAPAASDARTAVWTGTEMIVWGGYPYTNTGGRYNPRTDSWTATSTVNAPTGRVSHTAVWTGSEMMVWGGEVAALTYTNTGGRYDPPTDSWTATSASNVPSARRSQTAVWAGGEMIVWGGYFYDGSSHYLDTGGRYNPIANSWTATSTTSAPTARDYHTAVWTDSEMIVWGGYRGSYLNTGGRYCAQSGSPTITLGAAGRKVGGINTVRLTWSGATSTNIDVYRNGALVVTTANDGSYTDSTGDTGRARYTYRVCEANTDTCSNDVTVRFQH
jgi:N-acetylneuraminic acid mutarotase